MSDLLTDLKKVNSDLEKIYEEGKKIIHEQPKTITISFRGKNFAINRPKHNISIAEHKDFFTIAVDGLNEIDASI